MFTYDRLDKQWYGTNPNLLIEAINFPTKNKQHFNAVKFLKQFYKIEKKEVVLLLEQLKKESY